MTTTATVTDPATELWNQQFAALKARYPHVRPAILTALHIVSQDPDISLDDAKAQAAVYGARITAASVAAAQRLLAKQADAPPAAAKADAEPAATAKPARQRRATKPAPEVDSEALIRQLVGKLQDQGEASAERLRTAMRQAIAVLQAAL